VRVRLIDSVTGEVLAEGLASLEDALLAEVMEWDRENAEIADAVVATLRLLDIADAHFGGTREAAEFRREVLGEFVPPKGRPDARPDVQATLRRLRKAMRGVE